MKIVEKNAGTKIDFEVSGTKITFADELMLNPSTIVGRKLLFLQRR